MEVGTMAAAVAVIVPVGSALAAWGALRQRLISHERQDDLRFKATETLLTEVRDDVKDLWKAGNFPPRL